MPQMLHLPGSAFTSLGCIGQMYPLVADGMSLMSGRAVPGISSCADTPTVRTSAAARMYRIPSILARPEPAERAARQQAVEQPVKHRPHGPAPAAAPPDRLVHQCHRI